MKARITTCSWTWGDGTASLSFCPDRAVPWPLRGAHRWSDKDLLRVNDTVLGVDQALAALDFIWDEARITDLLVNACLVREALDKDPITLSDEELQDALDAFRRGRKLYTAEDTHRWMKRHGLTHEKVEALVADEAIVARLRQRVTAGRLDAYFEAHRADFDLAMLARIEVPDEGDARRLADQVRSGELSFFDAAQQQFLRSAGANGLGGSCSRPCSGGRLRRTCARPCSTPPQATCWGRCPRKLGTPCWPFSRSPPLPWTRPPGEPSRRSCFRSGSMSAARRRGSSGTGAARAG